MIRGSCPNARSSLLTKCALRQASMPTIHGVSFSKTSLRPSRLILLFALPASKASPEGKQPVHPITGPAARLFDYLVGAGQERGRDRQPEPLRSLEIDDQLEFGRLLDRQVGGPGTL